jgi:hypothetical protein
VLLILWSKFYEKSSYYVLIIYIKMFETIVVLTVIRLNIANRPLTKCSCSVQLIFALLFEINCTEINQSQWSNIFMYIIKIITSYQHWIKWSTSRNTVYIRELYTRFAIWVRHILTPPYNDAL